MEEPIIYKLNLFKKKLDINKYDKHLISKYIFIFFILQYIYIYLDHLFLRLLNY